MKLFTRRHKVAGVRPATELSVRPATELYEVLSKARDHIIQYGWGGGWGSAFGPTCIMGAVGAAVGYEDPRAIRSDGRGLIAAQVLGFRDIDAAIRWNDHSADKALVIKRFDIALAQLAPAPIQAPLLEGEIRVTDQRVQELVA